MRSIYLGKTKKDECPNCYGPKQAVVVGQTKGGKLLYSCNHEWHTKAQE